MALPASEPANHTFNIADTFLFSSVKTIGLPANNTSTTGLPVFNKAFSKSFCVCGISKFVLLALSPLISAASPSVATITSLSLAIASASSSNCLVVLLSRPSVFPNRVDLSSNAASSKRLDPLAYKIFALEPTAFCKPSFTVTAVLKSVATLQVPGIFSLLSPSGPITAMVFAFAIGKILLLFFSNTKLSAAVFLAAKIFAGVPISVLLLSGLQYRYGSENKPSLNFASKILLQASSICLSVTFFCCSDLVSVDKNPSPTISISIPAFKANADTC